MKFLQSYFTDIGTTRNTNQDSLTLLKAETDFGEVLLAVVCDGMGGHQSGELASKTIVKQFEHWFKMVFPIMLYDGLTYEKLKLSWGRLVNECNSKLVQYGRLNGIEMGSTLTAILFVQEQFYVVHVGDSRGYIVGEQNLFQITQDHSLLADEVRRGIITEEEAKMDNRKNVLLECVGITPNVDIDYYKGSVMSNLCYMICSDGFWHKITEEELSRYLSGKKIKDNKMLKMHLNYLVEQVKSRGERDNISVIGIIPY